MKNRIISVFSSIILWFVLIGENIHAQGEREDMMENVRKIILEGNSKELSKYFDELIDLRVEGKKENYSSEQATVILDRFFTKYPSSGFSYIHRGASQKGKRQYTIGKYAYQGGIFRVFILIEKIQNKHIITLIDFEEEEE